MPKVENVSTLDYCVDTRSKRRQSVCLAKSTHSTSDAHGAHGLIQVLSVVTNRTMRRHQDEVLALTGMPGVYVYMCMGGGVAMLMTALDPRAVKRSLRQWSVMRTGIRSQWGGYPGVIPDLKVLELVSENPTARGLEGRRR